MRQQTPCHKMRQGVSGLAGGEVVQPPTRRAPASGRTPVAGGLPRNREKCARLQCDARRPGLPAHIAGRPVSAWFRGAGSRSVACPPGFRSVGSRLHAPQIRDPSGAHQGCRKKWSCAWLPPLACGLALIGRQANENYAIRRKVPCRRSDFFSHRVRRGAWRLTPQRLCARPGASRIRGSGNDQTCPPPPVNSSGSRFRPVSTQWRR